MHRNLNCSIINSGHIIDFLDAIASPYVPRCFSSSAVVVILSKIQAEDDLANCENVAAVRNL